MAALASSAVSNYPTDLNASELYPFGKGDRGTIMRRLKLVLTGQGGLTNTIGATALGFKKLLSCTNGFDKTNGVGWPAAIDPVANTLLLFDGVPTDVTTTALYITVVGTPTERVN